MSLASIFRSRIRRELFIPGAMSAIVNPFHIARRSLYSAIQEPCQNLAGDVLDFGCGSKPYRSLFKSAATYRGVDLQATGHDHRTSEIDFHYDGHTLPFAAESYDAVVSFETLEHVFNPGRILEEISRVTRSGGHLLLSVPFVWDEHEVPYDFGRYTSFGLQHLLRTAGYEILWTRKSSSYVLTIAQLSIAYLSQHLLPRKGLLRHVFQLLIIFPLTLLAYCLDMVLPKRHDLFLDCVILARKPPLAKPNLNHDPAPETTATPVQPA